MKISIITPNLSGNCAGRAWVLGKLLKKDFEVEIIGPTASGQVWAPLEEEQDIKFIPVQAFHKISDFKKQAQTIRQAATGDALYVSKPIYSIMYPALLEQREKNKGFFLDIDDWQMGFQYKKTTRLLGVCRIVSNDLFRACGPDSFWNALLGEINIQKADAISVSNNFLQSKYGGCLIPHARDGSFLNPDQYHRETERKALGLPEDARIITFIGSPRPHKGLEDLIEAVYGLQQDNIALMIVGLGEDKYSKNIRQLGENKLGKRFIGIGVQSYANLPKFLGAADLVVIPQRKSSATVGQTPAKVFDAMAMGKSIIATDVGDLPVILEDCGYIVPPGDVSGLSSKIADVLANEKHAQRTALQARKKFLEVYEMKTLEKKISNMAHEGLKKRS